MLFGSDYAIWSPSGRWRASSTGTTRRRRVLRLPALDDGGEEEGAWPNAAAVRESRSRRAPLAETGTPGRATTPSRRRRHVTLEDRVLTAL
jgi:hypothetical protein